MTKTVDTDNAGMATRGNYADVLKKITNEGICPFCREHFLKHHTKPILAEGEHWLVTENAWPYKGSAYHFLVVSLTHIERAEDMTAGAAIEMFEHYRWLCREYNLSGATIVFRSGETAITGATVKHLHFQVIVGKSRNNASEVLRVVAGFTDSTT